MLRKGEDIKRGGPNKAIPQIGIFVGAIELDVNCYILCATGFAEESVAQADRFLQEAGCQVTFLGTKAGAISSATGTTVTPTVLLSQLIGEDAKLPMPQSLLVAGGAACGQQLLADPRVHRLIQSMGRAAKPVGFLYPVAYSLVALQHQQTLSQPLLIQEEKLSTNFLRHFGQRLMKIAAIAASKEVPPPIS